MKLTEGYKKRLSELAGIHENSFDKKAYLSWKRKNVTLRGMKDSVGENGGLARWGSGLYTAALSNRAMAKGFGDVYFVVGARPKNPKKFNDTNLAEIWIQKNLTNNGYSDSRDFFADGKTIAGEMLKLGYDGLEIVGREIVNYSPDEEKIKYYQNEAQLMDYFEMNSDDLSQTSLEESDDRKLGQSLATQFKTPYVVLYRATPITVSEFRDKDYTTLSKQFAIDHAESNHVYHEEPFHVLQAVISTDRIFDAPNPGEYFYSGPPKKAKVIYISKGDHYDLEEENKPYHFYIMCDKLCNKEGVEVKNAMVAAGKQVTREEFVKNCAYAEDMFEYESQMLDDPSHGFYKSTVRGKQCYYMQYAGFEFIFTKDSKEKPFWLD